MKCHKGSSIIWISFNLPKIIYLLTWHPMACAGISWGQKLRENFQTRFIFCSSRFYKIFSYILSICLLYSIMLESQILYKKNFINFFIYKNPHIEPFCYVCKKSPPFYRFWLLSCPCWFKSKSQQTPSTGFDVITP